jgi:hypothetical protein
MFMKYIAILCDYYKVALHIPLPPLCPMLSAPHILLPVLLGQVVKLWERIKAAVRHKEHTSVSGMRSENKKETRQHTE